MPTIKLNEQAQIPILGFGTYKLTGQTVEDAVLTALETGYRHIDTADVYENHRMIGKALGKAGLKREEYFLTSKVWHERLEAKNVLNDGERFLTELQVDYLDLLLIHWPNKEVPIQETLKALTELKNQGLTKAIGVSNFTIHHLQEAVKTGFEISLNQVEFHPTFNQAELLQYCQENNIALTAYSPIGQATDLNLPVIKQLAEKYSVSASQIILNWHRQKNIIAIPRSSKPEHIKDNFKSLDWDLENKDVLKIDQLHQNQRLVAPDYNEFEKLRN